MREVFKMKEGAPGMAQEPVLEVVGKGHRTYLWIGNGGNSNRACYATISGKSTLNKLVKELQEALK